MAQRPRISPSGPFETTAAPGTAYQTVEDDGAALPQELALNFINATLADNPGNASTDVTLHYQSIFNSDGGAVPQRSVLQFSSSFVVTDDAPTTSISAPGIGIAQAAAAAAQTSADAAAAAAAAAQTTANAAEQPFRATYYVDPNFAGATNLGSASNPFKTIAAAFAAIATAALTSAIIYLAPGTTTVENVVFPTSGNWEISGLSIAETSVATVITGTITANATANARFGLTNLFVTGAISGNISGGTISRFYLTNAFISGAVTLTGTTPGANVWRFICNGAFEDGINLTTGGGGGGISGTCSISGVIFSNAWDFQGAVACAVLNGVGGAFSRTVFHNTSFTTNATASCFFTDCDFVAGFAPVAASGAATLFFDSFSMARALRVGMGAPTGTVTVKTSNSNGSSLTTDANNRGSTALGGRAGAGLYEMVSSTTLLASGTVGALQTNAIYTDMTGTLVTAPVGPTLAVNGAVGTKAAGTLQFQHNGAAAPIAFSTTGVVTPGGLSVAVAVALRRVD